MKLGDMPAFPVEDGESTWDIDTQTTKFIPMRGMTLRQHYAGLAMQGLIRQGMVSYENCSAWAKEAVICADALLAALEKQP